MNDLHLKYRPKSFDGVLGHDTTVKSLQNVLEKGLCHSFLLSGPKGVGKTTLARLIAKTVKTAKQNILEINAAYFTGVDSMRSLTDQAAYYGLGESSTKTIILDEAHQLSKAAWQTLQKPVEEPPSSVYWVFCTTEPGKIPETISSRCVCYTLSPLLEEDIADLIGQVAQQEDLGLSEEVINLIARKSEGSPRRALTCLSACASCGTKQEALEILRTIEDEDGEVIAFCRALIKGEPWINLMKIIKSLKATNAESIRLVTLSYMSTVIMNSKSPKDCERALSVLECFSTYCNQSEGMAPILLSLGRLMG